MPLYNSKFSTSTEQAVADAAAKAQRYAQEALRSSNAAQVYYEKMVGIGVDVSDFARLDGAAFTGPVTFTTKPSVDGQQLITLQDIGPSIEYNFEYQTYQDLVDAGTAAQKKGTIYFIPRQGSSTPDVYDEYVWVPEKSAYELIGNTQVDLSGYVTKTEFSAYGQLTTSEFSSVRDEIHRVASFSFDYYSKGDVFNKEETYSKAGADGMFVTKPSFSQLSNKVAEIDGYSSNYFDIDHTYSRADLYSRGETYSRVGADTKFLSKQDATSNYATKIELSGVRDKAEEGHSAYSWIGDFERSGFSWTIYSYSEQGPFKALGAYYLSETYSSPDYFPAEFDMDTPAGHVGTGMLLFNGRFTINENHVEWGSPALSRNADGTYGATGYMYLCRYYTSQRYVGDGVDVKGVTLELVRIDPLQSGSSLTE